MSTPEDYQAKADEALAQLADAKSDSERLRLKRARGAYLKLASHGAETSERASRAPERLVPEKRTNAPTPSTRIQSYFK